MKHRSDQRARASNSVRRRTLQFDVLEERRLFAGMDGALRVLVFEDPLSVRVPNESTSPAAERVVFIDLNRDGAFQSQEPWSITDTQGIASFEDLAPGNYSIRLISQRSVLETTSRHPAETGVWTPGLGVSQGLDWESDTVGWFAGPRSLQQWDVSRGELLDEIPLGAPVASVAVQDESHCLAIVRDAEGSRLLSVNRQTRDIRNLMDGVGEIHSFAIVGDDILVLASNEHGQGMYRVPKNGDPINSLPDGTPTPEISGLSRDGTTIHTIGPRELVLVESLGVDTRISSWQHRTGGWQLVAERMVSGEARFSTSLSDASRFVVEIPSGLAVLNNTSGLPFLDLIEQASGPVVFDASRDVLMAHSKEKLGTISSWSTTDWDHLYDIAVSDSAVGVLDSPWGLSLGYLKDQLIAVIDGKVYRHALTTSVGASVSISDSALRQLAIGLRTRGTNRPPTLGELPDFATDEDVPMPIPSNAIANQGSDADGDAIYYFVRSPGDKGQLHWTASAFAIFHPTLNANGSDSWSVQAFDGRAWSEPQSFRINIRPVNDAPSGISVANDYRVAELNPGATVGRLEVVDPDIDAAYRYAVSDGRFIVANGLLKLAPGVTLDYETSSSLVVSVSAVEINQNDFLSKEVTVHVEDRNDPPQGILFNGSGAIPEKVAPYVVGNIGVIDQDRSEIYNMSVSDPRFEVVNNTIRVKPGTGITYQDPGWVELTFVAISQTTGDTLSRTERFRVIKDDTPYHNDENPMDVDGDGDITPLDPLFVINYINNHGPGAVSPGEGESGGQIDVDGDGQVTPLDILLIINTLNERNSIGRGSPNSGGGNLPSAEGEGNSEALPSSWMLNDDDRLGRRSRRLPR